MIIYWFLGVVPLVYSLSGQGGERIVVAGGDLTEIIYALGAQSQLVGVDSTSRYPPEAESLPQVGYLRALSAEGILSLDPTMVVTTPDAGPPQVLEQLRTAGLRVVVIPAPKTPAGVLGKITQVAETLGFEQADDRLLHRVSERFATLAKHRASIADRPRVALVLHLLNGVPLAAGDDTAAAEMITLAGGVNAFTHSGYRAVGAEALIAAAPEVLVVTDQVTAALGNLEQLWRLPGVAQTPAGHSRRVVVMDSQYLLGFGPRAPEAALDLLAQLHKDGRP